MMKRLFVVGVLAMMAVAPAKGIDKTRIDKIWQAATDRMSRQADAWFKDGDFPRVVQLLKFHYALDPNDYEVATNLGWMLENIEQWDDALAVYIQLRTSNPTVPDDAWPEANYYFQKKAYAKIPPILEPSIKGKNPHPNLFRTLAHAYERMNMLADSKRVWQAYIEKHPEDETAKANLTRVEKKLATPPPKVGK